MHIGAWTDAETDYCLTKLGEWRSRNFRQQEDLIAKIMAEGALVHDAVEIRKRLEYLDRLTDGDFSPYELLTIPAKDKKLLGTRKSVKKQ